MNQQQQQQQPCHHGPDFYICENSIIQSLRAYAHAFFLKKQSRLTFDIFCIVFFKIGSHVCVSSLQLIASQPQLAFQVDNAARCRKEGQRVTPFVVTAHCPNQQGSTSRQTSCEIQPPENIMFAVFVARMEETRLPKCEMFGELAGGAG